GGGADVSVADAATAQRAASASQRPAVSAELPSSELDGLSLLGLRARSVAAFEHLPGAGRAPAGDDGEQQRHQHVIPGQRETEETPRRLVATDHPGLVDLVEQTAA